MRLQRSFVNTEVTILTTDFTAGNSGMLMYNHHKNMPYLFSIRHNSRY